MHRLPDRSALGVKACKRLQNLSRASLALFFYVKRLGIVSDLFAHIFLINNQSGQPEVWLGTVNNRVHMNRQIAKSVAVSLIYCLFLCDVFFQMRILTADNTGDHVAHAVVVADFLVLIPRGVFTRLCRPLARPVCRFRIICEQASAGGTGDDFVAVIADCGIVAV